MINNLLWKYLKKIDCRGNVASVAKALFISNSGIANFLHVCLKLNLVLISRLTDERATQNFNERREGNNNVDALVL